jgi:cytochrome P450 PksS
MPAPFRVPDLSSPAFKADPHPTYARMRAEAPVCRTRLAWFPAWIVMRYDDALTVLKDERFSKDFSVVSRWAPRRVRELTRNLINLDPPDHTRLRTLVSKAFTPRMIEKTRGRIEEVCGRRLDGAAARGRMELVEDYALPVPMTLIGDLLGIPAEDRRQFAGWSRLVGAGATGRPIDMAAAQYGMWRFGRYIRRLIARRRADPRDDLVTALVQAEEAGDRLTEQELVAMIGLLLFAGYETTVGLIACGALALLENPVQRDLLLARPELAEGAVEELLRYTSPTDFSTPRTTREEVTIAGVRLPKGALVMAGIGSANRDPARFPDPDRLDITREPDRHLAFGMGIHFCVGAPLARLEAQIALPALFRRFPALRLDGRALRWRRGMLFRGLEELPVSW